MKRASGGQISMMHEVNHKVEKNSFFLLVGRHANFTLQPYDSCPSL